MAPQREKSQTFREKNGNSDRQWLSQLSSETQKVVLILRTGVFININCPNIHYFSCTATFTLIITQTRRADRTENDFPATLRLYIKPQRKSEVNACSLHTPYTKRSFYYSVFILTQRILNVDEPARGHYVHFSTKWFVVEPCHVIEGVTVILSYIMFRYAVWSLTGKTSTWTSWWPPH